MTQIPVDMARPLVLLVKINIDRCYPLKPLGAVAPIDLSPDGRHDVSAYVSIRQRMHLKGIAPMDLREHGRHLAPSVVPDESTPVSSRGYKLQHTSAYVSGCTLGFKAHLCHRVATSLFQSHNSSVHGLELLSASALNR